MIKIFFLSTATSFRKHYFAYIALGGQIKCCPLSIITLGFDPHRRQTISNMNIVTHFLEIINKLLDISLAHMLNIFLMYGISRNSRNNNVTNRNRYMLVSFLGICLDSILFLQNFSISAYITNGISTVFSKSRNFNIRGFGICFVLNSYITSTLRLVMFCIIILMIKAFKTFHT